MQVDGESLWRVARPGRVTFRLWRYLVVLIALHAPCVGCTKSANRAKEPSPETAIDPATSLTLRVQVVNEPGLEHAINRLRGEWAEQGIGTMSASDVAWADVAKSDQLDSDVIIFPSRYLGDLCSRGWLRPLRTNVLESDNLKLEDFFPLVRQALMKWDGKVMAAPLGVDLIWGDVHRDENPGVLLLARAAPRIVSNDRLGALFDSPTMKPRITRPEFVAALEDLVESQQTETGGQPTPEISRQSSGNQVPVVGYSDRLGAVSTSSRNAASAFKLLEWLARADVSTQFARAGLGALPARKSLASSPSWFPTEMTPDEQSRIAEKLAVTMNKEAALVIPRIPAIDDYLSALAEAVALSTTRSESPQAALERAAKRWEEITDAYGRESQRDAYLKYQGISD